MRRADVDAMAGWGRHDDPLFRHYNVPLLSSGDADALWAYLSGSPLQRRPFAGLEGDRVVASLILRGMDPVTAGGEIGIIVDPACLGRGLGRRILEAFVAVLGEEGFRRLQLEVAGYNERAIAAYRAAGFVVGEEYWADPEPGIALDALPDGDVRVEPDGSPRMRVVRMERRITR